MMLPVQGQIRDQCKTKLEIEVDVLNGEYKDEWFKKWLENVWAS